MLSNYSRIISFIESHLAWPALTFEEWVATGLITLFFILTTLDARSSREKSSLSTLRRSFKTNIALFFFNSAVLSLLSVSSLLLLAEQFANQSVLDKIPSELGRALLAFLLLDLMLYLLHKTSHRFDWLWMFHKVHHNEPHLNASTTFRLHPVEVLITTGLKAVYIYLLGVDRMSVAINEAIITAFVMFHHSNITFLGERWFGQLFIVPYLHRAHHSTERSEHDSNYGATLSIWDRLFGTLNHLEPAAVGIKGRSPMDFFGLLKFGFIVAPSPATAPVTPSLLESVAEAAYYKAEKRDFLPGYEVSDWIEAEREIRQDCLHC